MHRGNEEEWKTEKSEVENTETMIKHPWQVDRSNSFWYRFLCSFFRHTQCHTHKQTKPIHGGNGNKHAAFELSYSISLSRFFVVTEHFAYLSRALFYFTSPKVEEKREEIRFFIYLFSESVDVLSSSKHSNALKYSIRSTHSIWIFYICQWMWNQRLSQK